MNLFLLLCAIYLWSLAFVLAVHIFKQRHRAEKRPHLASEMVNVVLFLLHGIQVMFLFDGERYGDSLVERTYAMWLFLLLSAAIIFFFGLNVLPNIIRKRRNPGYRQDLTYAKFIELVESRTTRAVKTTDISRKLLHVLQFFGVVFFYVISIRNFPPTSENGISSLEFRNFVYFVVASLFWITLMVGDITRMENWIYLPKWGMRWFEISLDIEKEKWTINGASTILLANMLWIQPIIPIQVFFVAVWVSCISDAMASFVGQNFGNNLLGGVGKFSQKTWEGLIAGGLTTFIGVVGIMLLLPDPIAFFYILTLASLVTLGFVLVDLYGTFLCDNLLNSIVSAGIVWVFLYMISII
ncbi:MAG: hypothetical protein ACTSYI_12630 [Promethearchaeota archaeon]